MFRSLAIFLTFVALAAGQNLERQSEQSLLHAERLVNELKKTYDDAGMSKVTDLLGEIANSTETALRLLKQTGKSARKSPKYFKRAELKTREFLRRLESFSLTVGVDERQAVEKARSRVQKVREALLADIMGIKD